MVPWNKVALNDVVFSKDGEIKALTVDATVAESGYGTFAFPFYGTGYGWQPYDNIYTLPYGPTTIGTLEPFDYSVFNGYWYVPKNQVDEPARMALLTIRSGRALWP